jgi:hypothetical protein
MRARGVAILGFPPWRGLWSGCGDGRGGEQVGAVFEVAEHELGHVGAADGVADGDRQAWPGPQPAGGGAVGGPGGPADGPVQVVAVTRASWRSLSRTRGAAATARRCARTRTRNGPGHHRVRSPRFLDSKDPHGCGSGWQVQDSNLGRLSPAILQIMTAAAAASGITWANMPARAVGLPAYPTYIPLPAAITLTSHTGPGSRLTAGPPPPRPRGPGRRR